MGEIAEMMLDGTLCAGCGEYLHQEATGFPGFCSRRCAGTDSAPRTEKQPPHPFTCSKSLRAKIEKVGTLHQHDAYHWTVRVAGKVLADWWPHKRRWRLDGQMWRGDENDFLKAIQEVKL